jgi:hypothetical protein
VLSDDSCKNIEEVKIKMEHQSSATKPKTTKTHEKSMQQTQLNIETKIDEANSLVTKQRENKTTSNLKPGHDKKRGRNSSSPRQHPDQSMMYMHHNPHMQFKDPRREGEDKRAISGDRRNTHIPAHSPSTRQPTTAEKYTLFGHSEDSTICKTPQTAHEFAKAAYVISPYFFNRNQESRFNFARSMDPREETEYLNMPEEIQEILERNIRTISNKAHKSSIDNTSSTDIIDFREDWAFPLDRIKFEDVKSMYYASRRSSPHHMYDRHNLSPRSQMNKKSGSLTKRQYEDYMIESNFNQF